jgi:hypothetical protein
VSRGLRLVASVLLLAGCARLGGEAHQPSHNAALALTEGRILGQTFTVAGSGIVGLDLLMATFAQPADPSGTLTVVLRTELDGAELARGEIPGEDIDDNAWVPVRFDGPQSVTGRPEFEVSWSGAAPVGIRANVPPDPLPDDVLVNDPYPGGELVLDGELAAGDLAFRVLGADGAAAAPRTLRGLAGGVVRGLAAQPAFAFGWSALLLGCLALAVAGFRHRVSVERDPTRDGDPRARRWRG